MTVVRDKIILPLVIIAFASFLTGFLLFILPVMTKLYNDEMAYHTKQAAQATNYPNITTPLSKETATDLCKKFEIDPDDKRCQSDAVVYGPDFFADIKLYFFSIPENEGTFELVESKLGSYLVECDAPTEDGRYRCFYDLRGDGIYPIIVLFNEKDLYYQIFADTFSDS